VRARCSSFFPYLTRFFWDRLDFSSSLFTVGTGLEFSFQKIGKGNIRFADHIVEDIPFFRPDRETGLGQRRHLMPARSLASAW
jgi:hypothetical protein